MNKSVLTLCGLLLSASAFCAEPLIRLPAPDKTGGKPLMQVLTERQSKRAFSGQELTPEQLSGLLYAAYGVNRADGRHTAPTARNRQDMYIYVALSRGVYQYIPADHSLKLIAEGDRRADFGKQKEMFGKAAAALAYVSNTNGFKSPEDKLLYPANHAGYISQNVYLYAASAGLSTVVCGMVDRDSMAKLLNLPSGWKVLFTQPVGVPEK